MATGNPSIGTRIRRARERLRWTQLQLATAVGVDVKTVRNWEAGRGYPRNRVGALEDVLGIDLDGPPQPEPKVPSDALRAQILEELGPERGAVFIAEMERRLAPPGPPSPPAEQDGGRRPALARPPGG